MHLRFLVRLIATCAVASGGLCIAAPGNPGLSFHDSFQSPRLDSAWTVDAAPGCTVRPVGGVLEIRAASSAFAHIERPLGEDFIRASAEVYPSPATTWCTSVFVYWNPSNWCQLGIIDRSGGTVLAAEMVDGVYRERELGRRPFDTWHPIAVEVAADCIRYLVGTDGGGWKTAGIETRPEQFSPVPQLLILGKGYGGPAAYAAPDLDNSYESPGGEGISRIRNVRVEALERSRLRETAEERGAREAVLRDQSGEAELASGADPSFESVSRHFPPLKFSREVIGVKDHPHAIGVAADGTLQPNDGITETSQPVVCFEVGKSRYRFGSGPSLPRKRLHEGWMPMVTATDEHEGVRLEETAFGWSEGMATSAPLHACVRLALTTTGAASLELPVRLVVRRGEESKVLRRWDVELAPGAARALHVKLPYLLEELPVDELTAEEFAGKESEVAACWSDLVGPMARFSVPEERVQNAYRAWLAYNFLNVRTRDGVRHICDGSGFYNIIYGYSAALYCHILDLMGNHEQSRVYLDDMLTFQQKDGLWYLNYGHTDTGTMLAVLAYHYRLTGDAPWLRRMAPKMIAMSNWIREHRKESMFNTHGRRATVHGLIRFRPYCDYEMPAFDYYSNAYLCVGLKAAGDVLKEIGMVEEGTRMEREAAGYRSDILLSMDAATLSRDGARMIPMMPENEFLLKESNYTANGYYGLIASCLLETGLLDARDKRTELLLETLRTRGGLTAGMSRFFDKIDHAYTYGYWSTCMARDEVQAVILGLYGSMAYGMSRDTYAAVEVTRILTGENDHTLPHTYSNTKQIRLLRNMLLREDGDDLQIAPFIPRAWLAGGQKVAVTEAPTSFGPLSFNIEPSADATLMTVRITPPTQRPPAAIRLRLRHPTGAQIREVEGQERRPQSKEIPSA